VTDQFIPSTAADVGAQPADADLTAIAALDATTAGVIASDGAGWIKKTYAQFKTALGLMKADVGLGNVDNTADAAKSVASAAVLTTARNIDGQAFDGSAAITVIAPGTHAAASKATPVDADELPLVDSAAANVLKKLTWANVKAALKTYFDTLYMAAAKSLDQIAAANVTAGDVAMGGHKITGLAAGVAATDAANVGQLASFAGLAVYGDGSDGAVTFDGSTTVLGLVPSLSTYTLTRDIFLASSTINNGVTIITNGFRIFCSGTLTNNGTIKWNGGNGSASGTPGGAAAANANSSFNTGTGAAAPGTGGGAGSATAGGSNGVSSTVQGFGGRGGSGGAGTGGAGGVGGTQTAPANGTSPRWLIFALLGIAGPGSSVFVGGTGGGGGGTDVGQLARGGAGGAGGGIVIVAAKTIAGTGSIQARGGNGSNGNGAVATGGGDGGGGGVVIVISQSASGGAVPGQTIDANGGSGGVKGAAGGSDGVAGSNGLVLVLSN
jgi:hypothetical protein